MIDVHCHVLPGVDDGPRTDAEAVAMAQQADADGIRVVCATPHIRADHAVHIDELADRVAALNRALDATTIATRIAVGGEVAEPLALALSAQELRAVSYGGAGRWLLLEPRPGPLDESLRETVVALGARGLRCVIAHPERHATADLGERLAALVAHGALVQVTAAHLDDAASGPPLLALAARGLVHLLGSDAHHPSVGRRVELSRGLRCLASVPYVHEHLGWIATEAPAALLRGADVTPPFAARA
jgi:protein-tyrosine phosphatase